MKTVRLRAIAVILALSACNNSMPARAQTSPPVAQKKAASLVLKGGGAAAVIDLSRTPAGALFEAKMLGNSKGTWVERAQVDKVVGELELQALFSPEGGSKRVGLGKLLKADLLVLLRAGENPEDKKIKHLQIVVCESKYGLRLAADAVPLTGKADAQVAAMAAVFDGALAKLSEKITDVCAVPPFLSLDLDFKHDHLKSAYARVLGQHLLQRKGILLVEFAEAQALAKEAVLAGDGAKMDRWLPLYFLGAFRNEGTGAERRVEFDLKVQRGDQTIGSKQKVRVAPLEAPKQLGKLVDELADRTLTAPAGGVLDPKAEIKQLLLRATAYEQLGNWQESVAMLEAALLLDPDQPAVNLRASHAGALVVRQEMQRAYAVPKEGIAALHHYRRAMEHLELSARALVKKDPPNLPNSGPMVAPAPSNDFTLTTFTIKNLKNQQPIIEERVALWHEVMKEERAIYLRLCRLRARAGAGDEHRYLTWATESVSGPEKYDMMRAMIVELKDLPLAKERTIAFALQNRGAVYDPQTAAFAEELAKNSHAEIKAAGEYLKKSHADYLASLKKKPVEPAKKIPNAEIRFVPIDLTYRKGPARVIPSSMMRWLPAGPNLDFLICPGALFMMKEKGVLDTVWWRTELNDHPHRFCYDGRYLWFSIQCHNKTPRLLVADPQSLETWEFTADDGLPLVAPESLPDRSKNQNIDMAALGPGRVCLVGSFGRTWLAMATFDPKKGKTVKVFHEAREAAEAKVGDLWMRTTVAFEPSCVHVLTGEKGARRVLIGRNANDYTAGMQQHPLLVDPDTLRVEVMKDKATFDPNRPGQARDGAVYRWGAKVEFPGVRKSLIDNYPPYGIWSVLVNDEIHVCTLDKQWWHGSLQNKKLRHLGTIAEGQLDHVGVSSHYGVVILLQRGLQQVVVTPTESAR